MESLSTLSCFGNSLPSCSFRHFRLSLSIFRNRFRTMVFGVLTTQTCAAISRHISLPISSVSFASDLRLYTERTATKTRDVVFYTRGTLAEERIDPSPMVRKRTYYSRSIHKIVIPFSASAYRQQIGILLRVGNGDNSNHVHSSVVRSYSIRTI